VINNPLVKLAVGKYSENGDFPPWALQRTSHDGIELGDPHIPYGGKVQFTSFGLGFGELSDATKCAGERHSDSTHQIYGSARPGIFRNGKWLDETEFSLFGSRNTFGNFEIRIEESIRVDDRKGYCEVIHINRDVESAEFGVENPHTMFIAVILPPEQFAWLMGSIRSDGVDAVELTLIGASGLYVENLFNQSHWRWLPRPTHLTILGEEVASEVMGELDLEVSPPRIRDVEEFKLETRKNLIVGNAAAFDAEIGQSLRIPKRYNVDKFSYWLNDHLLTIPEGENGLFFHSQFNTVAKKIAPIVAQYSIDHGETNEEFGNRLHDAMDCLKSIARAANEEFERNVPDKEREEDSFATQRSHCIWFHGNLQMAFIEGTESDNARKIDANSLKNLARQCLSSPWMDHPELEKIMIDALIFDTVRKLGEEIKERSPGAVTFMGFNPAYFAAKGNMQKMALKNLQYFVMKWAAIIGLPILLGWYFWSDARADLIFPLGAVYFGIVLLRIFYHLVRKVMRKSKSTSVFIRFSDALEGLIATYGMLSDEFVNPSLIRGRLVHAVSQGVELPGVIFSLLDHAIKRNPIVWQIED
jgi:hypothetical protein